MTPETKAPLLDVGGENLGTIGVRVVVQRQGVVSEERKARIDQAIEVILRAELERAERIIKENRHLLDAMVATLLEKKVIDRAQIKGLING